MLQSLSTTKLSDDQESSHTLNLLTGFHVITGAERLIILEGLADCGQQLLSLLALAVAEERSPPVIHGNKLQERKVLFNDQIRYDCCYPAHHTINWVSTVVSIIYSFGGCLEANIISLWCDCFRYSARLYSPLGVNLWIVKLRSSLQTILSDGHTYAGPDAVSAECIAGLSCLQALRDLKWSRQAHDLLKFPTADMMKGIDKKFGGLLRKVSELSQPTDSISYWIP